MSQSFGNEYLPIEALVECSICKSREFDLIHSGVHDFLFGAPGSWSYRRCKCCSTILLDPRPVGAGLDIVYTAAYSERKGIVAQGAGRQNNSITRLSKSLIRGILASSFGYSHIASRQDLLLARLFSWIPGIREHIAEKVMRLNYLTPESTLLDVGCGVGQFISAMKSLGWNVVGVDTDARVVEIARAAGLDVLCGPLESFNLPEASFDVITLRHVLEHVSDPIQLLCEVRRLLKPGGQLLVTTPNAGSVGHFDFEAYWLGLDVSRHMQLFTKQSLTNAAAHVGFKRVDVHSSARITRIVATVSQAHRQHAINAYKQQIPISVWLYGFALMIKTKFRLAAGCDDGEELFLRSFR